MEDTDYALGRTSAEYDRLIEQAELLRPITERVLRAAGICAGMHVLDVGCGVGDVSFLASSLIGPQGWVVGVDLDRDAIQIAEKRCAEQRLTNARSMLPKIVEYGLATEEEVLHTVEQELCNELLAPRGLTPLSWLMIGQWARKPMP